MRYQQHRVLNKYEKGISELVQFLTEHREYEWYIYKLYIFIRHIQSLIRKGLVVYDDYSIQCFIKIRKMKLTRNYDTNEDVLVVRKSEYQNNNIDDEYFVVPKEEWYCEYNGLKS